MFQFYSGYKKKLMILSFVKVKITRSTDSFIPCKLETLKKIEFIEKSNDVITSSNKSKEGF